MKRIKQAITALAGVIAPAAMALTLTSPDFKEGMTIPDQFTCQGIDTTPTLNWSGEPKETESFVMIMLDPDAPHGTWYHWVVYNLPDTVHQLDGKPHKGQDGLNSWGKTGYGGPCPPSGTHRYIFTIYALRSVLVLPDNATIQQLEAVMDPYIIERASLTGLYSY